MISNSTPLDSPAFGPAPDWPVALAILRDAGAEINRIGPATSLPEALQLIAETAVRLLGANPDDGATAVIYTYDAAAGAFDPGSRVSAGEGDRPLTGDTPRPGGVGAKALARRARVLSYEEDGITFHPLKSQAGIHTAACCPLLVVGQPVGALYIDLRAERRFTEAELLLLDTLVHLAAVAIYNTHQFEGINRALQRKVDELERLQRAERLISSRLNLDDTLREILRTALELTSAEHGSFRLLDKRSGRLRLRALEPAQDADSSLAAGLELDVDARGSVMGWVAQHRQPVCIADRREPPWSEIYRPLQAEPEMRSELAVPLFGPGQGLEGVVNVESPRVGAFDAEAQRVLEALATQAVIAIQEAKLLDALEEVTEQVLVRTPDELFALLIERACDLLNVPHAAIWELERVEPPALILRVASEDFPARYRVPVAGTLLGVAVTTGRPAVSANLGNDPRLVRRDLALRMGWKSALIVPMVARDGAARGAFGAYSGALRSFSDWDTRLLTTLAHHAAAALQQAEALAAMKLAEERQAVAETFAVLGDVAANLLHRINNLIGVIPLQAQGIVAKRPALLGDAYIYAGLRAIEDSARAAMEAARETMVYLRPLRLKPIAVETAFQTALDRLAIPPAIQVAAAGLKDLPPVWAGEEQLRLVFVNLIENALDAIGSRPGRVGVFGRVVDDPLDSARRWVEITISDDGPGVDPAHREQIFAPNFSTKHSAKKLGFGLWWVKSWVQRFGGAITLADLSGLPSPLDQIGGRAGEAEGCTLVIRLPLAAARAPDPARLASRHKGIDA